MIALSSNVDTDTHGALKNIRICGGKTRGMWALFAYSVKEWPHIAHKVSWNEEQYLFCLSEGNMEQLYIGSGSSLSWHISLLLNVDDIL